MSVTETEFEFTYYRPGLLFLSPRHANYQYHIRDAIFHINPHTAEREQIEPPIMAEFGDASLQGNEYRDDDGQPRAEIRGGSFDLDEAAERYGWSDEIKEIVAMKLLRACAEPSMNDFHLYEPPKPVAPFPKYDDLSEGRIPQLAAEFDLLDEALQYERATHKREKVIAELEKKLGVQKTEDEFAED